MENDDYIDNRIIEDLLCRFILNLPPDEKKNDRLFFHIQAAHWFYTDFYVNNNQIIGSGFRVPDVALKEFSRQIYKNCPFLKKDYYSFNEVYSKFNNYLFQIPVFGAIILNKTMDKILLVTHINGRRYGFPKGKINQNETGLECAIREVWEETGLDIAKFISEKDFIEHKTSESKISKMYIVSGFSESTSLRTITRGEIGSIEWISLSKIEDSKGTDRYKYSNVLPYVKALKVWIQDFKMPKNKRRSASPDLSNNSDNETDNKKYYYDGYDSDDEYYIEVEDQLFLSFSRKLEEISNNLEREMIPIEEKNEPENPLLNFKLDRTSLIKAFL